MRQGLSGVRSSGLTSRWRAKLYLQCSFIGCGLLAVERGEGLGSGVLSGRRVSPAHQAALQVLRLGAAEMSCIAGVGGYVKPLVLTAKSGRPIIALDGCPLQCTAKILERQGLRADKHVDLSALGVKKRKHEDFDPAEAARVFRKILDAPDFPARTEPDASASTGGQPAAGEIVESSSPPCYLSDFTPPES